eukprot:sb/3464115/
MSRWLLPFLTLLITTHGRTYKDRFYFDVYEGNTPGELVEVQKRSFLYTEEGTLQVTLQCSNILKENWGARGPVFNVFLCDETPRTNWLYLYPIWGMCFNGDHPYHHCTISSLTQTTADTWTLNTTVAKGTGMVARIRPCPIYSGSFSSGPDVSVAKVDCLYTGIMMNGDKRLSGDETWNPLLFACLTVIYGALTAKAVYEIVRYWNYFIRCSIYVYCLLFCKFGYVLCGLFYYNFILRTGDTWKGYQDWEFLLAMTLAGKFTAYYISLFMIASGYCIYNSTPLFEERTVAVSATVLFTCFFYLFIINDSYVEVPMVVILSAAYAAILALFWAFHFKRLLMVRYEFHGVEEREGGACVARQQVNMKEILVGLAFAEIIAFLIFIIVFEFFHAENYPIPGSTGVMVVESLDFLIIAPLVLLFNTRDLSKFYPTPPPPPIIHIIKTPGEGMKISIAPGDSSAAKLFLEEEESDHVQVLPFFFPDTSFTISDDDREDDEL